MTKIRKMLALGDLFLCLVLLGAYGYHSSLKEEQTAATAAMKETEENGTQPEAEIRRIALTFDDEDIIGSSQRDAVKKRFL